MTRGEEIGSLINFFSKDTDESLKRQFRGNLEKLQGLGAFSSQEFIRESPQVKREAPSIEQNNRLIMQIINERKLTEETIEPEGVEKKELTVDEKEQKLKEFLDKKTEGSTKDINDYNKGIENIQKNLADGKITKEYADKQIADTKRFITSVDEFKTKKQQGIKSEIAELKKSFSPEEIKEKIENNKEELGEIDMYLELGEGIINKKDYTERKKTLEEKTSLLETTSYL